MKRAKSGFTLVELIIVIGLFSLVTTSVYAAYKSTNKIYNDVATVSELRENADKVQRALSNDIRRAKEVILTSPSALNPAIYEFSDRKCKEFSDYCTAKNYKPVVYIETLNGSKFCYAYNPSNAKLLKITSSSTSTTTKYYIPQETEYYYRKIRVNNKKPVEKKLARSGFAGDFRLNGVKVYYYSGFTKIDITGLTVVGAYHQGGKDNLVVERNNLTRDWYEIPLKLVETYTSTFSAKEYFVGEYLKTSSGGQGITIVPSTGSMGSAYDITIELNSRNKTDELKFKASMIDMGVI